MDGVGGDEVTVAVPSRDFVEARVGVLMGAAHSTLTAITADSPLEDDSSGTSDDFGRPIDAEPSCEAVGASLSWGRATSRVAVALLQFPMRTPNGGGDAAPSSKPRREPTKASDRRSLAMRSYRITE